MREDITPREHPSDVSFLFALKPEPKYKICVEFANEFLFPSVGHFLKLN